MKNIVERSKPQTTIWRMRIACWRTKATRTHAHTTHTKYALLIAFPLQQRLQERSSILRYTLIACVVISQFFFRLLLSFLIPFIGHLFLFVLYIYTYIIFFLLLFNYMFQFLLTFLCYTLFIS